MISLSGYQSIQPWIQTYKSALYKSVRSSDNRPVTVKAFKGPYPESMDMLVFRQLFHRLRDLKLDGMLQPLDLIDTSSSIALVYEEWAGMSIKETIAKGPLDLSTFFDITAQLCSILAGLQKNDIVHYGIKPSNILIHPQTGQVKLMDAGIHLLHLKTDEDIFNPDVIHSCLSYFSPEQTGRINRPMDYRTDMYSLGITFFEMLTGALPFESDDPLNVIHGHLARPVLLPQGMNSRIPDSLIDITRKLLSKNAEARYQNALGVLADLSRCRKALQTNGKAPSFVLGQKDLAIRFTQSQILVGRDKEISAIWEFIQSESARPRMMVITGPPGIGKTALIYEINKPVLERRGYFVSGKYEQFKRDVPYSAIIQALTELMKQISSESREKFERWKHLIRKTLGANGRVITQLIPASEMIIGPQPPLPVLDPEAEKNRFQIVFLDFLRLFVRKDHPLVVFLDDLQWADLPSIHLVKTMMTDPTTSSFYVIASYRGKEISTDEELSVMLDDLTRSGFPVNRMTLGPIGPEDIERIFVDRFKIPPGKGLDLARILHRKTLGNPFFVNQCLKTMYEQGLISLDPLSGFHWDKHRLNELQITENVVALLSEKIMSLSRAIQDILKIGACIGNRFELAMLSQVIGKHPGEILESLTAAMDQGFLLHNKSMYVFSHDRIQEAAYALIPENERPDLHYRIAGLELANTPEEMVTNKLFYITEHMNRGMNLINGEEEKLRLISMNLSCARKAKNSSAYSSGARYIEKALLLTPPVFWETHYPLMSDLNMERLELSFYMGNYTGVYDLADELMDHIRPTTDKIHICKIKALAYNAENRFRDTLGVLNHAQTLMGMSVRKKATILNFLVEYIRLRIKQAVRRVETWDQLPPMTDPERLAYCNLETVTNTAVYFTDRDILTYNTLNLVQRIFKHGVSPELPYYLTGIGFILIAGFNRVDLGYRFGRSGIRLLEKQTSPRYLASSYHIYNGLIRHWKEPLKFCLDDFKANYHRALETGDLFFASYSLWYFMASHFRTGTNLLELHKLMEAYSPAMAKIHQTPAIIEYILLWTCVLRLIGLAPDRIEGYHTLASLSNFPSRDDLPDTQNIKPLSNYYEAFYSIIHHRYHEARGYIDKCLNNKEGLIGVFLIRDLAYIEALTLLALLPQASRFERGQYVKTIRTHLEKLRIWSKHAPENCSHMAFLVRAEFAAVRKKTKKAHLFYGEAISHARINGYIQDQAFALEKAAMFYTSQGLTDRAAQCIREAKSCYRKWGAETKQKELEILYPEAFQNNDTHESLSPAPMDMTRPSSAGNGLTHHNRDLDVWSILKVSRALSEEIVLENLLSKLMTLVIESAGAQRGCIIFEQDGVLTIEAEKGTGTDVIRLETRPIDSDVTTVSTTIVNLTTRSRQVMLVDDASHDMSLSHDSYIQTSKPKSVLCVPMISKGRLSSLLYLENNESAGAFTPKRVDVVQLLAQQAVVSIENAKLYRDMSRSEEKYRTILESIEDGYYELDLDGNCTFGNSSLCEMMGYSREEILALNINDVMPRNVAVQAREIYRKVKENGKTRKGFEHPVFKKDGQLLFVEGSVSLVTDSDGEATGFRGLLRDITQRKESEKLRIERDVAEKASHTKSMFLANMSHEIRTPMNAILGFASLLKERVTDEQGQGFLDTILSSGRMLMMLLNDILDLSKIEAGKMPLKESVICPSAILYDLKRTFSQKAEEKGNSIVVTVDENLPPHVVMDEIRIRQILMNLTGNASKFTENGTITLALKGRTRGSCADLEFSVNDTGMGIAPDHHGRIFETFEQTEDHNTAKYGGTGLGLALCRKLAQAMGGELIVSSTPGVGSTFTATFRNVAVADQALEETGSILPVSSITLEPATILIADDSLENRQVIGNYLNGQPVTLIEAKDGVEALAHVDQYHPDLVLMDLFMPKMDGFEATSAIKLKHPSLPVIAVTASVLKNEEEKSRAAGCLRLLRKPLEKDDLIRALTDVLAYSIDDETPADRSQPVQDHPDIDLEQPSPEVRARIPELVTLLEDEMNGPWNDIKEIFVTEQIQAFTDRIIDLGNQYSQDSLVHWATAVQTHTSNIDMEKTFQKMEQFPDIIDRIAEQAIRS